MGCNANDHELTLIRSVNVVDVREAAVTTNAAVLIEDGRIAAIGPNDAIHVPRGAVTLDGAGGWLIPGLIDVHTHTANTNGLQRAFALGITSSLVVYTGPLPRPAIEDAASDATAPMSRVYLVGGRFSAEFPGDLIPGAPRFEAPADSAAARTAVEHLASEGVQAIKIWQDDAAVWVGEPVMPTFSPVVVRELIASAHAHGMKAYVHAWDGNLFREALPWRPDGFVHPILEEMTQSDVEQLEAQGLGWVSTFTLLLEYGNPVEFATRVLADSRLWVGVSATALEGYRTAARGDPAAYRELFPALVDRVAAYVATVGRNARRAQEAGLTLAVGSDATAGYGTHLEMEMLAEAGLSPAEVLQAATLGGARFLGVEMDFGTVEVGKVADLVLLTEDPLADVRNLRAVRQVLKAGRSFDVRDLHVP
jgi:imidazolonepropionase-like amidohydrolase